MEKQLTRTWNIELQDRDGDGFIKFSGAPEEFSGCSITLRDHMDREVVADMDNSQLLTWCERVSAYLRGEGVVGSSEGIAQHR
jgi:hypothetical protein